jgi:hypothetical protein
LAWKIFSNHEIIFREGWELGGEFPVKDMMNI